MASFRSTLEETREASVLLHVIDAASEQRDENIQQVGAVLEEIGADEVPQLHVYNKIDLLEAKKWANDLKCFTDAMQRV